VIADDDNWASNLAEIDSIVDTFGTPCYLYNFGIVNQRISLLKALFAKHFSISYAVKSNPNRALLKFMADKIDTFDTSSFGEVERVLEIGGDRKRITFSGPGKRRNEIERALNCGIGELVIESEHEVITIGELCRKLNITQKVLLRINPLASPKNFGASMAGNASQFGVDEEVIDSALEKIKQFPELNLEGFHIYSGTNCLMVDAVEENFLIMLGVFRKACEKAELCPSSLVMGTGFGIPYLLTENELDINAVSDKINAAMAAIKSDSRFSKTTFSLELGRWLVGPAGLLLTSVIGEKYSRNTEIRLCDAGFNNHLAACGMMGSVIRRNWVMENLTSDSTLTKKYNLVGPLCTSIDLLARDLELPETNIGDVIAISNSGAYGLTASPTRFISHPEPRELAITLEGKIIDCSESMLNHWKMG